MPQRLPLRLILLVLLLLFPFRPLEAQAADSLPALRHGSLVRAELQDGARVQGLLVSRDRVALTLRLDQTEHRVPVDSLNRLWVRRRSTRTGIVVGAVLGAAGGAALAYTVVAGGCEGSGCNSTAAAFAGGGLGALGGGVLGAVVGAAIPRWRLRFP